MKKLISLLAMIFAVGALCASAEKTLPKADIEVVYDYTFINPNGKIRTEQATLLTGSEMSKYFNRRSEWVDSMESTPRGRAEMKLMINQAVSSYIGGNKNVDMPHRRPIRHYAVKSLKDGKMRFYDSAGTGLYYYDEPLGELQWTVGDSTKTVLGYECVQASADYHGRTWTAWFTPDIPVSDGPWKLHGLPGLILEAADSTGSYSFTATGLQKSIETIHPPYRRKEYDKAKRKDIYKMQISFMINPFGGMTEDPSGNPITIKGIEAVDGYDFIETDYN